MSQIERVTEPTTPVNPVDAAEWLRANWITVTALLALAAGLWWRAGMLARAFFRQDDFQLLDHARGATFGPTYLLAPVNGRLAPGGLALAWIEAHAGLYSWVLAATVTLVLLALAGLALLRLLRYLFGNRPAVLAPLAIYLATPLMVSGLSWWSTTLGWLPLHIATFCALTSHVHYVRTNRFRHVIAATCWIALGMLFDDRGALLPLVLLALTSAFLFPGRWPAGVFAALRRQWRAWLCYLAVTAAYLAVVVVQVSKSGFAPHAIPAGRAASIAWSLVRIGFIPGSLGGPWRWWSSGSYAVAVQMPVLTTLSLVVAAVIVAASLWFRRRAWRAWAILLAWLTVADLVPLALGWSGAIVIPAPAADLSYLADAVPLLVICLSLAFWPVTGEAAPYRTRLPGHSSRIWLTLNAVGVIVIGSAVSSSAYQAATTDQPAGSYIATARLALAHVPAHTQIVSAPVPASVMNPALFGGAGYTASVLGPLAPRSAAIGWTTTPHGTVRNLMIFDGEGRLWPAIVSGIAAEIPAPKGTRTCWQVPLRPVQLPLRYPAYRWNWLIQLGYSGPATTIGVEFAGRWHYVALAAGRSAALLPAPGRGMSVTVEDLWPATGSCLSYLTVGTMQASVYGRPVPATPVSG